ncbi:MAG: cysteine--tRNA ligase [Candidatus Xenobiia bacterium LiM19]
MKKADSMKISLYNTLSRSVQPFVPIEEGHVRLYTCGPTVYDFAHIGNFKTYVVEDLLRRVLKFAGFRVTQVMNITDIDDKIIKAALNKGVSLQDFTAPFTDAFFQDIEKLNIEKAEFYPRATDHIPEMVTIIDDLVKKGVAYKGDDNCYYFSIGRFERYGALARINRDEMKTGVRITMDEYEKETASDFALWKAWDEKDGVIYWDTLLGRGRPGWHIECSAMSMKYLGEELDIHMGGVDNIFPHHENEIAQSEAYTGKQFVRYWVHSEHLLVDGKKMSKKLGNFYTLRDIIDKGYSPAAIRYLYISTHYRSKMNFTFEALKAADNTVQGLKDFLSRLLQLPEKSSRAVPVEPLIEAARAGFCEKIADDLNTPQALASLFNLITQVNIMISSDEITRSGGEKIRAFLFELDSILGLRLSDTEGDNALSDEEQALIDERAKVRKEKNFKRSDEIRDLLKERGIEIKDTPTGVVWKRV